MKQSRSSNTSQKGFGALAVVVVIAIIAAAGGFYLYKMHTSAQVVTSMENQVPTQSIQPTAAPYTGPSGVTSPNDTSDKALDADTTNINAKINAVNSDSVNVDQSLSTTPENLTP